MIILTRQNGTSFAINDELIQTIEEHPDTTLKMTDGKVYIVSESVNEVIDKIVQFRQRCMCDALYAYTQDAQTNDAENQVLE